ncbi:hypothetical protein MBLNU230_g7895t1 [Neophaeotheca triangularis]
MDREFAADHGGGFDGGRSRGRPGRRNATDIGSSYVQWMRNRRPNYKGGVRMEAERPAPGYVVDMLPPAARKTRPADTIPAKHLHTSLNKIKHPVGAVAWTPEGRRLITASSSGEFTLWNGSAFNFETITQAHEAAVRALCYSHNNEWLISSDSEGVVKYFQTNFNNVKHIQAHDDCEVRGLAFAPTDTKFATAGDDNLVKIFDFAGGTQENELSGHSWDVKCVDWHPSKGLVVSGSKDSTIKFWDPRTARCLTTLHGHKNTVAEAKFEPNNGVLLASCGRDRMTRVFDIRMMRDVFIMKSENERKEVSSLVWHPIHSSMLTTGGGDGSVHHYLLDEPNTPAGTSNSLSPYDTPNPAEAPAQTIHPAHVTQYAHDMNIWSMAWHPLGHILATGSNDKATRFWTRPRPGDKSYIDDRWHIGQSAAEEKGTWKRAEAQRLKEEEEADTEDEADGLVDQKMPSKQSFLPGLPGIAAPMPMSQPTGPPPPVGVGQPPPFPGMPSGMSMPFPPANGNPPPLPPGLDLEKLKEMFGGQLPPLPPPGQNGGPPPGFPPMPPGFQLPPGFPPPGNLPAVAPTPDQGGAAGSRRRAPLPSQQESLQEQMRQGRYTKAR